MDFLLTLFSKRNVPLIHRFFLMTLGLIIPLECSHRRNLHAQLFKCSRVTDPDPGQPGKINELRIPDTYDAKIVNREFAKI